MLGITEKLSETNILANLDPGSVSKERRFVAFRPDEEGLIVRLSHSRKNNTRQTISGGSGSDLEVVANCWPVEGPEATLALKERRQSFHCKQTRSQVAREVFHSSFFKAFSHFCRNSLAKDDFGVTDGINYIISAPAEITFTCLLFSIVKWQSSRKVHLRSTLLHLDYFQDRFDGALTVFVYKHVENYFRSKTQKKYRNNSV